MNNQIINFSFNNINIRTFLDKEDNVWFCLKDICDILKINNPSKLSTRLNPDGITNSYGVDSKDRKNTLIYVNEPNLYRTITNSRKPTAIKFENWIFEEVIPSIRKKGYYSIYNIQDNISELKSKIVKISNQIQLELFPNSSKTLTNHYKKRKKKITITIDFDKHRQFKSRCALGNMPMRGYLRECVDLLIKS